MTARRSSLRAAGRLGCSRLLILKAKCVTLGSNLVLLLSRPASRAKPFHKWNRIWVVIRLADGKNAVAI